MAERSSVSTLASALAALQRSARRNTDVYASAVVALSSSAKPHVGRRVTLSGDVSRHVGRYGPDDVEPLTHFHSVTAPSMAVGALYRDLTMRAPAFDDDTGLIAVTLMLRYQRMTGLPITTAMLHRLFITAALVASKTHHDCRAIDNGALARLFSVQLIDLNLMERRFLAGVDFRVAVFASDLEATLAELARAPEVAAVCESDSDDNSHGPPLAGNQRLSRHGAAAAVDVGLPDDELPSSDTID